MSTPRVNSLAYCFQEVMTAVLRVRFQRQEVTDSAAFRAQMKRSLQSAMQDARALGYSSDATQMAVFAVVAFMDESVLNLRSLTFVDWTRQSLQEELFGDHNAGETYFRKMQALLTQPDSPEVADTLEVYCLCLQAGYRGRYALGDSGELHQMLRQAREKINRIRGAAYLVPPSAAPEVRATRLTDRWSRMLLMTACVLAGLTVIAFGGFELALGSGLSAVQNDSANAR